MRISIGLTLSIILISVLIGVSIALSAYAIDESQLQNWLNNLIPYSLIGALKLYCLLTIATALGLPRQIAAFCAGYSFAIIGGVLIATLATVSGCAISFVVAKYILHQRLVNKYPAKLNKITSFFRERLIIKAIIIRLIPAGSNFITNLLAGAANINFSQYIIGSAIGYIPQMLVFSLAGYGIRLGDRQHLIISAVLFLLALLLAYWLYQKTPTKGTGN